MDRDWTDGADCAGSSGSIRSEIPILPSRRSAFEAIRAAISAGRGPALLTGEAGSGKSWLVGRLIAELDGPRWLTVDVASTTTPADLLRAIAIGLGLAPDPGATADAMRLATSATLTEREADGRRWALVVDEAHLASVEVLEEARVLSNRLGQADGFTALVLVGQTALARRLATRALAALDARLSARVALGPIDADEAAMLLAQPTEGLAVRRPVAEIERLHRDAIGNPGRLLRLHAATADRHPHRSPSTAPTPPPGIIPAKPPLRVEDGLIEVGWEAESASEADAAPDPELIQEAGAVVVEDGGQRKQSLGVEEPIDDPYATLQAWSEWASNQGRGPIGTPAGGADLAGDGDLFGPPLSPVRADPSVRAEGPQEFAPYSQLFSRLKESRRDDG